MKKALIYSLSLAMLLSLAACHKPQAEQQEPAPSQAAASQPVQDPAATPEPPEQAPAAPVEAEASQPPEETTPTEPAPEQLESTQQQQPVQNNPTGSQQQTTPQQQTSSGSDMSMSEIEQLMKDKFLKDREEAKANGWTVIEGDVLTDEDIEAIGAILNGGTPQHNSTETQSSGSQSQEDKNRADNETAGQGLAGLKQWGEQHQGTGDGFYSDLPEGATIDETGNVTDPSVRVQG